MMKTGGGVVGRRDLAQATGGRTLFTYFLRRVLQAEPLRQQYGLDQPIYVQYVKWITNFLQGDMGQSFHWNRPVQDLIGERLGYTMLISSMTLVFTYGVAILVGVYSAVKQYTFIDYLVTGVAFAGLGVPDFLLALIAIYVGIQLGWEAGGLFSPEYVDAPWSMARSVDLAEHIWLPVFVVGITQTARLVRVIRAMTL